MLIRIPEVIDRDEVRFMRTRMDDAAWIDGRVTAGYQGAGQKRNLQLDERDPLAIELGDLVVSALERDPVFISAALPQCIYPPMFNRYESAQHFGDHVDNSIRLLPGTGRKIRTDVSATLFLADPQEYEGGELVIEDTYGSHQVKLQAGDMVLYPSTSLHRVNPVTRGARVACFFWVQSMIRDDGRRSLLYEMDASIQRLRATNADDNAVLQLTGCYHNLLRQWAEV